MLPEPLGVGNRRRVVIRQPSIVQVLTRRTSTSCGTPRRRVEPARPRRGSPRPATAAARRSSRDGAKDEQIARKLDLSLRTVRRRIAALMTELGVDTRFQAGVEAARRGWL